MPRAGCSIHWCIAACVLAVGAAASAATPDAQRAFACSELACGIPAQGAFPHFVVGRIAAIATADDATTLFTTMRARRRWTALPAGADAFWRHVQPVAMEAGGAIFVVLTGREEMRAAPLAVGDFVRYSPHRGQFEVPPTEARATAYWAVDGCVATLCRARDRACFERYVSGVYRTDDGLQLSPASFAPLPRGTTIDTTTMAPTAPPGSR